jgi:hypothetical protein
MQCKATVTFEFDLRQPITAIYDSLEATEAQTIASRAIVHARKSLEPRCWTSLVVVLERLDVAADAPQDA